MAVKFNVVITDEACTHAAIANSNSGWYLSPSRWEISSDSSGDLNQINTQTGRTIGQSMTYNSRNNAFYSSPFSGVTPKDNTLLHSVVLPPDIDGIDGREIKEIYFIYKDMYGNEFLYATAQPDSILKYVYGTRQQFLFSFSINPTSISNTYVINYTYPQDIQDHNTEETSHDFLLKRDGTRTATGILSYNDSKTFVNNNDIIDKKYADSIRSYIEDLIEQKVEELNQDIIDEKQDVLDYYCPIGSMLWWPQDETSFIKSEYYCDINGNGGNWMIRRGQALSKNDFPKLFEIIGYKFNFIDPYDETRGIITTGISFKLPNDSGVFIRGYDPNYDKEYNNFQYDKNGKLISKDRVLMEFGSKQDSAIPNIKGTFPGARDYSVRGAFKSTGNHESTRDGGDHWTSQKIIFDLSKYNYTNTLAYHKNIYGGTWSDDIKSVYADGIEEVRPTNRNYLPIIRVK